MTQPKEFLTDAIATVDQRGTDNGYDVGQERSAARVAKVFNALTDHNLTEADVWTLLIVLKQVRNQRKFKHDNIVDMAGYAGLLGECLAAGVKPSIPLVAGMTFAYEMPPVPRITEIKIASGHALDSFGAALRIPRLESGHGGEPDAEYRQRLLDAFQVGIKPS